MGGKKAGGGFLGIGGKSGFLNTGLFSSGPQQIKGFNMTPEAIQAEREAIKRQMSIASGEAPSIAQTAYNQNLEQVNRQAQALAASQRGVSNPSLGFRQAQLNQQQAGIEGAQQSALMALQERRSADEFLARQAAAQRGVAFQQEQMNQQAKLGQQQMNANFIGSLASSGATMASGGGGAAATSDENAKTDIKENKDDASKTISEFMDALKSYTYEYKKGAKQPDGKPNPDGEVKSVMAQDLEKTDLGKQMVTDTPDGKVVDYAQGMAPLLAAIAELNKRTKKLEGK